MAKKKTREAVKLKSSESDHMYWTRKNKKKCPERMERNKYDPTLRRHVLYKESK